MNFSGNIYHYRIDGNPEQSASKKESLNWDLRSNNTYKGIPETQIQLTLQYNGPSATPQGMRKGYFVANMGLQYNFLNDKAKATLNARDLLGTRKRSRTRSTNVIDGHMRMEFESPIVILSLKYYLNQKQKKDDKRGSKKDSDDGGEFGY